LQKLKAAEPTMVTDAIARFCGEVPSSHNTAAARASPRPADRSREPVRRGLAILGLTALRRRSARRARRQ